MPETGIWIIGDQASRTASSLQGLRPGTPVVFVESKTFCNTRPYHWQKLVLILSVMRHFAQELRDRGHDVHYHRMADDFLPALQHFVKTTGISTLRVMEPNDHPRATALPALAKALRCKIQVTPNNQFLTTHHQFEDYAHGRKSLVMEFFYRQQRQRLNILVDRHGKPLGGTWNLDKLNRVGQIAPLQPIPDPMEIKPDRLTCQVIDDVHAHFPGKCFGMPATPAEMRQRFAWPVTPAAAESMLEHFLEHKLNDFGPYEDAMTTRSWSLWHSHLSVAMNCGLLHPQTIADRTLAHAASHKIPLNSLEGFIRQIIGWREFIRGIYWREMSKTAATPYTQRNALNAHRPLPDFYWSAQTDMACVHDCVQTVIHRAYSHHIPRLMVLSNFALLHGLAPGPVNEWFIYAYADGYEWVTTPNVVGMSLYADGGIVATKPYAAGGAYINRMSDYCRACRYDPAKSTGPDACPFTRAYWPFYARHRAAFEKNPRTTLTVKGLARIKPADLARRTAETERWLDQQKVYG